MTEVKKDWQAEFELKEQLYQEDIEALEMALFKMPNVATMFRKADLSTVKGAYLRAAIAAGWIISPACKAMTDEQDAIYIYDGVDVGKLHPAKVNWLGQRVVDKHDAIMSADLKNL